MAEGAERFEVTGRAEAIDLEKPITVIEGVDVENPETWPLPFTDLFCRVCDSARRFIHRRSIFFHAPKQAAIHEFGECPVDCWSADSRGGRSNLEDLD